MKKNSTMEWLFIIAVLIGGAISEVDHECPLYWTPYGDSCYIIPEMTTSWIDIMEFCSAEGGYLAEVSSKRENDYITQLVRQGHPSNDEMWIGGTDAMNEGQWEWIKSRDPVVNYQNWGSGQPDNSGGDENCLGLTTGGTWNDDNCNKHRRGVCEKSKNVEGILGR